MYILKKSLQVSFWCRSYEFLDLLTQPAHLEGTLNTEKVVLCQQPTPSIFSPGWQCTAWCSVYLHPAVLGGPCSLHWHWYTARLTFPGVSHILPDCEWKAAPCQHSHTWKGCKSSTRKKNKNTNLEWTNSWSTFVLILQQDMGMGKKCSNILNRSSKDIYFNAVLIGSRCPEGKHSNTFCRYLNKGIAAQPCGKIQARAPTF